MKQRILVQIIPLSVTPGQRLGAGRRRGGRGYCESLGDGRTDPVGDYTMRGGKPGGPVRQNPDLPGMVVSAVALRRADHSHPISATTSWPEDASNLGLVLNRLRRTPAVKKRLLKAARKLYDGLTDFDVIVEGGTVQVFLKENGITAPATRLSDGTLRYLCLLAILCHDDPPPFVCIEEPELSLHPDIMPTLAAPAPRGVHALSIARHDPLGRSRGRADRGARERGCV